MLGALPILVPSVQALTDLVFILIAVLTQARLFEPHQIYTTEMGEENIDLATSVVAFESEGTAGEGCDGVLILFKLSGAMT